MRTTATQDNAFLASVISRTLLEEAINWIQSNMEPEQVFTERQLESWAADHDYIKEIK